jgi:hypothetical protein
VRGHFALYALGVLLLAVCLGTAGCIQGDALNDPKAAFADIAIMTRGCLLGATAAQILLLAADIFLAVNFFTTLASAPEGGDREGAP